MNSAKKAAKTPESQAKAVVHHSLPALKSFYVRILGWGVRRLTKIRRFDPGAEEPLFCPRRSDECFAKRFLIEPP